MPGFVMNMEAPVLSSSPSSSSENNLMLCASCDRCRARKTKCDGQRPCGACTLKYQKQTGVTSLEGVPYHLFECLYSPAKKRGPNPNHHKRKNEDSLFSSSSSSSSSGVVPTNVGGDDGERKEQQQHRLQHHRIPAVPAITKHVKLLELNHPKGNTLRSFYQLAINEMFRLPSCTALSSASNCCRFAELALGALVNNETTLAMELCNAVVHCLQDALLVHQQGDPASSSHYYYDVAKTYYLLGVFRAFRGDFGRYFKYRRVCLTYLAKLSDDDRTFSLLAAVSYLDSWAYMIHNADGEDLDSHPITMRLTSSFSEMPTDEVERKYNIRKNVGMIAGNPDNQNWIQGPPPVFLNNEAPLQSRVLDALACAIRTCCDTANGKYCASTPSLTAAAVMCHENELCSRNMVLSAYSLLQQDTEKSDGLQLVVSSMDAFFENGGKDNELTDGQVHTLLSVCNKVIQNPLMLYHAGPTYHMITNAAVLLAHLLNGMTLSKRQNDSASLDDVETTLYDEVYDTYVAIRRVLTLHRRKLPAKIRCHGLPRATVDLGETLLCNTRSCQGFVLQACSPCVAAERAVRAAEQLKLVEAQEAEAMGDLPQDNFPDFDMDDDTLLDMINGLIQQ